LKPVSFSHRARADLLEIWSYIAAANVVAADRIADRIVTRCRMLEQHPEMGRARPDVGAGARSIVIDRWIAFYRVLDDRTQVVRIVDGRRDLTDLKLG
jgi:toxin ParE1/3/4